MMKTSSSILWALTLAGACLVSGCATTSEPLYWESALRGGLSLGCYNIDHLGFGQHYDIIMNNREAPVKNELLVRRNTRPASKFRSD
jgi:hypothetical protein